MTEDELTELSNANKRRLGLWRSDEDNLANLDAPVEAQERDKPTQEFKALGQSGAVFEGFETFPASEHLTNVTLACDDFTARCPVTNQPDFYSIDITYSPAAKILETKSVKLYLETFRETGIFAEHLASKIASDIQAATLAPYVSIMLRQRVRGGIETTTFAEIHLDESDESDASFDDEDFKQSLENLKDAYATSAANYRNSPIFRL